MSSDWAILDDDNNVVPNVDYMRWDAQHDPRKRWCVGRTEVGGVRVSTVFLGFDHGWLGEHEWFETMVFADDDHMAWDQSLVGRYETWAEAEAGHAEAVRRLEAGLPPWEEA